MQIHPQAPLFVHRFKNSADFLTIENQKADLEKKGDRQEFQHFVFPPYCVFPALSARVELHECVLRLCIRLRFQRSHTVPCFLVGSPGNKSAQGTLLWEAYGKEHMHVQPWGYITMYNNG